MAELKATNTTSEEKKRTPRKKANAGAEANGMARKKLRDIVELKRGYGFPRGSRLHPRTAGCTLAALRTLSSKAIVWTSSLRPG